MSIRLPLPTPARSTQVALLFIVIFVVAALPGAAQKPSEATSPAVTPDSGFIDEAQPPTEAAPVPEGQLGLTDAQKYFRRAVDLYSRNLFREALKEVDRALALDPNYDDAKTLRAKIEGKLVLTAVGKEPDVLPSFETKDVETLTPDLATGGPQVSAEELKIQRVKELLELGELYLENQRYPQAVKFFEEVLLIAPDNKRGQDGLHTATLGATKEAAVGADDALKLQNEEVRRFISDKKLIPADAGPDGIKPFKLKYEVSEEKYVPPTEQTEIQKALESPVSINMEGEHLRNITGFLAEYMNVNIVIDDRVVASPVEEGQAAGAPGAAAGAAGAPRAATPGLPTPGGMMGGPMGSPMMMGGMGGPMMGGPLGMTGDMYGTTTGQATGQQAYASQFVVTDGLVPYINLKDVPLRQALKALLRPMNLDYAVQPGFIWISTPERIREESFEELETRYYELRNAGAETLFKVVVTTPGSAQQTGGTGGGGGGSYGGGGGSYGGGGGSSYGGGGGSSYGGGGSSFGGGGSSGGYGGSSGGGGYGGGGGSSFGGGGGSSFGGGGGGSYGGGGGGAGAQITNISQLFGVGNDMMVGEMPAVIGISGGGTGMFGGAGMGGGQYGGMQGGGMQGGGMQTGGMQAGGGFQGAQGAQGGVGGFGGQAPILQILSSIIPDVIEPYTRRPLSYMDYNPATNQLIVHNTPTNLALLESQLADLDATPKQVSIEAKFITISINDLYKLGFKWDLTTTDKNDRTRQITDDAGNPPPPYSYDVNGDGVPEDIPFYTRPDGTNVIRNTITEGIMSAATDPLSSVASGFNLQGIITQNSDGDKLGVTMDYLNSVDQAELLSAPRVTTMNRKPAVIADITTRTFRTYASSEVITQGSTFGGAGSQSVVPREAYTTFTFGITLSVTPQISGADHVRLWLNPQVTDMGDLDTFTSTSVVSNNGVNTTIENSTSYPRTTIQSVWTNVIVHDGDTLVLGGLVRDSTIRGEKKMPYIADIPLLGTFFRGKSNRVDQRSLLIFVTTDIIDTTGARFFETGTK